ncbi:hypothetical protein FGG08_006233 [Glutinoglossum americanum]|uniref:Rad4-domain-containing protein n=1 Tax=Glutinoglossum americanum TaxID=1670608 RepID=A0A9P8L0L4_9PEZI|nr:hypothetical protein FGG08_006233 [Glutinoglossum americanum]
MSTGEQEDVLSDVYKDMLAEVASSEPSRFGDEGRNIKRRRVGHARDSIGERLEANGSQDELEIRARSITTLDDDFGDLFEDRPAPQVAYNDFEDSEESDVDWEEVDLNNDKSENILGSEDEDGGSGDEGGLDLVLLDPKGNGKRSSIPKRRPITAAERKLRLEIHKMHLLCLLYHVFLRNSWCNDPEIQATLKPLLASRTLSLLNSDPEKSQFQRTTLFTAGLTEASTLWASKFKITAKGMKRAVWADDEEKLKNYKLPEDVDLPMEKPDFRDHARKLEGSRDIGAQLFCALLRSVGVEARLVCSLQPLPFNFVAAKGTILREPRPKAIYIAEDSQGNTSEEVGSVDVNNVDVKYGSGSGPNQGALPQTPRRARRLWQPDFGSASRNSVKAPPAPKSEFTFHVSSRPRSRHTAPRVKRIRESAYPVYWVEAFNVAHQRWIPVDPLTTHSVGKPFKLEPPASEPENIMSYVVAFEDAGNARDITKRYAKAINAKTRKARVEATRGGDRWWKKTMRFFRREFYLDRDQVEDAELADREAREEMPRNVQDFKGHPYYALDRHLKRNEVIYPVREVGRLTTGPMSKGRGTEPIRRRSDVHVVKSADSWYRAGRDIKTGQQPLKHIQPKRNKPNSLGDDEEGDPDGGTGTGLYAEFQTVVYEPPPVVRGRVPKNSYGNIDIYVPSMVPKGGSHLPHPDAARAARLLRIDYADAVTGFEFKGRHGTAIIRGILAATEYREALEAVIQGFTDVREEEEVAKRSMRALAFWKRFMVGLRIRERIAGYAIPGEVGEAGGKRLADGEAEEGGEDGEHGGGFFPESGGESIAEPTARRTLPRKRQRREIYQPEESDEELAQIRDTDIATERGEGFVPDEPTQTNELQDRYERGGGGSTREEDDTSAATGGGGFIPEEGNSLFGDGGGGGFIPGEDDTTAAAAEEDGFLSDDAGGGGFIPEEGDTTAIAAEADPLLDDPDGGGFIPKKGTMVTTTTKETDSPFATANRGGFIPNDDPPPSNTSPPPATTNPDVPPSEENTDAPTRASPDEEPRGPPQRRATTPADSDEDDTSEQSSLISHDPEDDDAEPDWLLSD